MLYPECAPNQPLTYPLSVNTQKVLRFVQSNDYNNAGRLKINPELSLKLKGVMRGYIKYLLGKELKFIDWLDKLGEQTKKESK